MMALDGYTLRLVVNKDCNFNCFFCNQEGTSHSQMAVLDFTKFVKLAKEFGSIRPLKKISITGGEPLLYSNLSSLLREIRETFPSLDMGFTTNASQPQRLQNIIQALKADRQFFINVSLPSLQPIRFQEITRSTRYDDLILSIESLIDFGFSNNLSINYVYMPNINDSELEPIVDFAQRKNLRLKIMLLAENDFNRREIRLHQVLNYNPDAIKAKIENLGYVSCYNRDSKRYINFRKNNHYIAVVECEFEQPRQYFRKFRTLRLYYDGRIGLSGDTDGFTRYIDLRNPGRTFRELIMDLEATEVE